MTPNKKKTKNKTNIQAVIVKNNKRSTMDSVALWLEESEVEDRRNERIARQICRNNSNFMNMSEQSFLKNFRVSKDAFNYILNEIRSEFGNSARSFAIKPERKLETTLKFLGQGGYQHQIGQDCNSGLAQPTVSMCIREVCAAIEKILCPRHIDFTMTEMEKKRIKQGFYEKCGIPGVIGAIDGTHVQMIRPSINEHLFFNRKLKHSMNAMVICDNEMRIRAVDSKFGGSSHDAHIWNLSAVRQHSSWLIGDSGYPLEPWLLTPYRNATENAEETYFNTKFCKGRVVIERVFGVLKGRFRCLLAARELHYAPEKVVQIFNACCALHNICIQFNVPLPDIVINDESEPVLAENIFENADRSYQNRAISIRNEIMRNIVL